MGRIQMNQEGVSNIKVSIVIPVYNMERYLERCMESVLKQSLEEIEVILVDDGSIDRSSLMCDEYAIKDSRVKVIHQENTGLTGAWKAGSRVARGEYTGYVDSDDFVQSDMYERLYQRGIEQGADIVCCGIHHIYEEELTYAPWDEQMELPKENTTIEELKEEVFDSLINNGSFMGRRLLANRVTKIVKTSIVIKNLDLCNDEVTIGEDFQFSLAMLLSANKISIIRDFYPYFYYMNMKSMTMQYDPNYLSKIKIMKENLTRISKEKDVYDFELQIINDFLCLVILQVKGCIYKRKFLPYKSIREDIRTICKDSKVKEAIRKHYMPNLSFAEKLFIYLMDKSMYYCIYLCVKIYFK